MPFRSRREDPCFDHVATLLLPTVLDTLRTPPPHLFYCPPAVLRPPPPGQRRVFLNVLHLLFVLSPYRFEAQISPPLLYEIPSSLPLSHLLAFCLLLGFSLIFNPEPPSPPPTVPLSVSCSKGSQLLLTSGSAAPAFSLPTVCYGILIFYVYPLLQGLCSLKYPHDFFRPSRFLASSSRPHNKFGLLSPFRRHSETTWFSIEDKLCRV